MIEKKRSALSNPTPKTTKPRTKKAVKSAKAAEMRPPAEGKPGSNGSLRDEIALLAYSYWEGRGCQGGSAEDDWLQAEQEVLGRRGSAADR